MTLDEASTERGHDVPSPSDAVPPPAATGADGDEGGAASDKPPAAKPGILKRLGLDAKTLVLMLKSVVYNPD